VKALEAFKDWPFNKIGYKMPKAGRAELPTSVTTLGESFL
jgi:hypothetical protein